jgi:heme exporter protein CcmD
MDLPAFDPRYAGFVWAAFGASAALLGALALTVSLQLRAAHRRFAEAEARAASLSGARAPTPAPAARLTVEEAPTPEAAP